MTSVEATRGGKIDSRWDTDILVLPVIRLDHGFTTTIRVW
jgi:hypothetical protein